MSAAAPLPAVPPVPAAPTPSRRRSYAGPTFREVSAAVERMVVRRGVVRSDSEWVPLATLVEWYVADNPGAPDPADDAAVLGLIRTALGRRFGGVRRHREYVGLAAPGLPTVDVVKLRQGIRDKVGAQRRRGMERSPAVRKLREERGKVREERERLGVRMGEPEGPKATSFRYVDEFLLLQSAPDILEAGLFPNGKELAESMSAFTAVRDYMLVRRDVGNERELRKCKEQGVLRVDDPTVTLVVVGDGATPRTAGLFAHRVKWRCISIDPDLRTGEHRRWAGVRGLEELPHKVQDVTVDIAGEDSRVVVVAWHAHVSVKDSLACLAFSGKKWDVEDREESRRLRRRVALVTCACCQWEPEQRFMPDGSPPDVEFEDTHIPGSKRTLRVWRFKDA